MKRSLFELTSDALFLDELLEQIGGEITDAEVEAQIDEWLSEIGDALNEKLDAYVTLIAEFQARAEARKRESERLRARAQVDANNAERLKARLRLYFERTGKRKVETARFTVSLVNSGGKLPLIINPAFVAQPELLPEQLRKVTFAPDGDAIRRALESGELASFETDGVNRIAFFGERSTSIRIK